MLAYLKENTSTIITMSCVGYHYYVMCTILLLCSWVVYQLYGISSMAYYFCYEW